MSINRNDPCPCGSGQKYKKCCLGKSEAAAAPVALQLPDIEQHIATIVSCATNGNLIEATRICKLLLDFYPSNPLVLFTTARVMFASGMRDSCLMLVQKAAAIEPTNAAYYSLMAEVFFHEKQGGPAFQAISRAIELNPSEPAYIHFRAVLILSTINNQSNDEAMDALRSLTVTHPKYFTAYATLYRMLDEARCYDEAAALYQRLLAQNPPADTLLQFLGGATKNHCSREEILHERAQLEQNIDRLAACNVTLVPPPNLRNVMFPLTYHGMNNRPLLEKLSALYRQIFPSVNVEDPSVATRTVGDVIKIGFISYFFAEKHVVMQLLEDFIRSFATDRRYKTILFDVGSKGAGLSLIKDGLALHVPLPDNVSPTTYQLVAEQACDVLIYLDIGMHMTTYLLALARLAPIQCALNGHPITSGISTVDYYVSCKKWEADNAQDYYTEKLVLLEQTLSAIKQPQKGACGAYGREDFSFPEQGTLYACPVTTFKIHPDFYESVVKILQQDPQGTVLFFNFKGEPDAVISQHFQKIAPEESKRVLFVPWVDEDKFMPAMQLCDVILDPFHFCLATTLYKIFAVGTPVVTWTGEFMHGRIPTGLYQMMGITELIAKDWDDYVAIALRLGKDKTFNNAMRQKILESNHVIYGDTGAAEAFKRFIENAVAEKKKR